MRKLSKTRDAGSNAYAIDVELHSARPRRIQGSIVTARPVALDAELAMLLSKPLDGVTIAGASESNERPKAPSCSGAGTVSLSDGTHITFITAGQLSVLQAV